jgi:polygalacturonase
MEKPIIKVGKDMIVNALPGNETMAAANAERVRFSKKPMPLLSVLTALMYIAACADVGLSTGDLKAAAKSPAASTNRPMRNRQNMVLTVGRREGDLKGDDDKIIQAGIEYLHRLGGGTLHVLPGVYNLKNAIYLRPNITLKGSGEKTILR